MAITPSDFSKIWASNADTPEYTFNEADYLKGWDFVGNLPPTRAQWNAIQKRTDEKMKYVFDNFGAPLIASTVADMTLQNRVYVYTGSEVGYTAGHWYYYDAGTSAWVDGGAYNAVAVQTDKTLSISGEPADAKVTGDNFNEINEILTNGYLKLTSLDFVQGEWSTTTEGVTAASSRNIRTATPYSVNPGDKIITKASALYIRWELFDNGTLVERLNGPYDKTLITDKTHEFSHKGNLYITIANGHNYGNSSDIVPSDMTADITILNNKIVTLMDEVSALKDQDAEIISEVRTRKINQSASTTQSSTFIYYPMDFADGQTYFVRLVFSEFTSTYNRKFSLRTTLDRYTSSQYTVQEIVIVDRTDPVIGKEYLYKFVATTKNGQEAKYIALELNPSGGNTASCTIEVFSIKAEDAQTELDKLDYITATDIISLNHDIKTLINYANKPLNRATVYSLKLLHFSDIHGSQNNLQRIVDMKNYLGNLAQDAICTGDMVGNNYSETCMDFWDAVSGAENILTVVGNHELADGQHDYSSDQIGQTLAYQKYFSPYITNWGVTMAGTNLTYWYKDYATYKVRLIGLNYLLTGDELTAQNTWLANRLDEAKTNGYAVVIAIHTPPNSFTGINCNFNIVGMTWQYNELPTSIQDTVQTFIDNGGEFACYFGGHAHRDLVGYNSNYPNQLFIDITCALTTGSDNDQYRSNGTKSQDAVNMLLIDTVTKTIKLIRIGADMDCYARGRHLFSINYQTKTIIAES